MQELDAAGNPATSDAGDRSSPASPGGVVRLRFDFATFWFTVEGPFVLQPGLVRVSFSEATQR